MKKTVKKKAPSAAEKAARLKRIEARVEKLNRAVKLARQERDMARTIGRGEIQDLLNRALEAKRHAYQERNMVVALLARLYNGGTKKTDIKDWDSEWNNCVYIRTPFGQMSWHYHDSDTILFDKLPEFSGEWDGHTTEEKYERLLDLIRHLDEQKRTSQEG